MRPSTGSLAGHVAGCCRGGLRLFEAGLELARTAGRAPHAVEGLYVRGVDRPDRADLGSVEALPGQQTPDVGLGRLERGGGLGNRK